MRFDMICNLPKGNFHYRCEIFLKPNWFISPNEEEGHIFKLGSKLKNNSHRNLLFEEDKY